MARVSEEERKLVESALKQQYENCSKIELRNVDPGCTVLSRFDDGLGGYGYQLLIPYRINKKSVVCSTFKEDGEFVYGAVLKPTEPVVLMASLSIDIVG